MNNNVGHFDLETFFTQFKALFKRKLSGQKIIHDCWLSFYRDSNDFWRAYFLTTR